MMHVVYFGRTYYGTELWVPTMGNQGSIGYLDLHLSVVRTMPRLQRHTSCLFVWGCGLQLLEPCGLSWFSARGVRPWYWACTVLFQNTCTTLADSYNNDNIICYMRKQLWYGMQLNTTLVRLMIINRFETCARLHILQYQLVVLQ